jgi:D-alanyl-D-alanine carboxypeptidase
MLDNLKAYWDRIKENDRLYFRIIWIAAITVVVIAVLISAATVKIKGRKALKEAEAAAKASATEAAEEVVEEVAPATPTNALIYGTEGAWQLVLTNAENPLPSGYSIPEFTELRNGHKVDSRIYPDLQQMFDDARAEGLTPTITSAYKTAEELEGISEPGTNDHETGLSIDVMSEEAGKDADVWDWFDANCYKYGFINRYPESKQDVTGVSNDFHHYRYVGKEAAKMMYDSNQCLEEFLGK